MAPLMYIFATQLPETFWELYLAHPWWVLGLMAGALLPVLAACFVIILNAAAWITKSRIDGFTDQIGFLKERYQIAEKDSEKAAAAAEKTRKDYETLVSLQEKKAAEAEVSRQKAAVNRSFEDWRTANVELQSTLSVTPEEFRKRWGLSENPRKGEITFGESLEAMKKAQAKASQKSKKKPTGS